MVLAGLGDPTVKGIDVAPGNLGHLHPAKGGPDVAFDHVAVVVLGRCPLAGDVLLEEALEQIIDGRGAALGLRSRPADRHPVTQALEPARLLAGAGDGHSVKLRSCSAAAALPGSGT